MNRRRAIEGKMKKRLGSLNCVAPVTQFFLCLGWWAALGWTAGSGCCYGQAFEEWFAAKAYDLADPELDEAALWDHYREWWEKGLDVTSADQQTMENSRLLSAYQIRRLLDYRKTYGPVTSLGQLSWVDGFTQEWVRQYAPFLRFGTAHEDEPTARWSHQAVLRSGFAFHPLPETYLGPEMGLMIKYQVARGERFEAGCVVEQDVGEPWWLRKDPLRGGFPDYLSAYVCWAGLPLGKQGDWQIKRLVLGSYQLRLGQGLTLWRGFSMQNAGSPSQLLRRSDPVAVYRSADENQGLSGVCLQLGNGHWEGVLAVSARRVDARIEDGEFFSLPQDGYHRTLTEYARRKTLTRYLGAWALRYQAARWQMGVQGVCMGFDKPDGRRWTDYRARTAYSGVWYNGGIDFRGSWASMQVYGEVAVDRRGTMAALMGWEWAPVYGWEMAVQWRCYDPAYTAPDAGAWSAGSSCSNEHSFTTRMLWRWGRHGEWALDGVWVRYPAARYRVEGPSETFSLQSQVGWQATQWQVQLRGKWQKDPAAEQAKKSLRLQLAGRFSGERLPVVGFAKLQVGSVWCQEWGRAVGLQLGCSGKAARFSRSGSWEMSGSVTGYRVAQWDDRIYLYQRSLPGTFSFPALYGEGINLSAYLKYEPRHGCSLMGAWSLTGLVRAKSQRRSQLQIQLQYVIGPS